MHVLHSGAHFKHFLSTKTVPALQIQEELVIGSLINVSMHASQVFPALQALQLSTHFLQSLSYS